MKKVWKCDHCSSCFDLDKKDNAVEHEDGCSFNIKNETCWTCNNRFDDGAPISGHNNACKKGHSCFDREEDEFVNKCEDYE